ncbi:DUF4031 domain-containing protein [Micromonospora luteifusca]
MISDVSYAELHAFAEALGAPRRAARSGTASHRAGSTCWACRTTTPGR